MNNSLLQLVRVLPDWFFVAAAAAAISALMAGMILAWRRSNRGAGVRLLASVALALLAGATFYQFGRDLISWPPIDAPDPVAGFAQSVGYALDFVRLAYLVGTSVLAAGLLHTLAHARRRQLA